MENLFLESPGIRRKFLDRMTYNFFSNHAEYLLKYEYFTQSRAKILYDIDSPNCVFICSHDDNVRKTKAKICKEKLEL